MVSEGRDYMTTQWWVPTFPALAILVAVTGFNSLGDGLRDLLDPRLRRTAGLGESKIASGALVSLN